MKFYDSSTGDKICDKHMVNIWKKKNNMKSMKDYLDLHLKGDVFIISWERFKCETIDSFELGSAYCLSTAVYSWVAMLITSWNHRV